MTAARPSEILVPNGAEITRCRSCQASIVWVKTENGRAMPLSVGTARDDEQGRTWMLSHFADCPHAPQHRRQR